MHKSSLDDLKISLKEVISRYIASCDTLQLFLKESSGYSTIKFTSATILSIAYFQGTIIELIQTVYEHYSDNYTSFKELPNFYKQQFRNFLNNNANELTKNAVSKQHILDQVTENNFSIKAKYFINNKEKDIINWQINGNKYEHLKDYLSGVLDINSNFDKKFNIAFSSIYDEIVLERNNYAHKLPSKEIGKYLGENKINAFIDDSKIWLNDFLELLIRIN